MREAVQLKGHFWLPETPQTRVPGTASYDPLTGVRLDLDGSFVPAHPGNDVPTLPLIHGQLANGHLATLSQCLQINSTFNFPSFMSSSAYRCAFLFDGVTFRTPSDIRFDRLVVGLSNLDEWVDTTGFQIRTPRSRPTDAVIRYRRPAKIATRVSSDLSIDIAFGVAGPNYGRPQTTVSVTQSAGLLVTTRSNHDVDYFLHIVYLLQGLLSLAVGVPVFPMELTAHVLVPRSPAEQKLLNPNRRTQRHPVKIYFQSVGRPATIESQPTHQMLFSLPEVRERWSATLCAWLARYDELQQSYQLYISMLYRTATFIEEEFLGYARAIESYHRRAMNNLALPETEFERRKSVILAGIAEDENKVRKWIEGKLKYSNEPSLEQRLRDILNTHANLVPLSPKKRNALAKSIADARNDLTHPGNRSGRPAPVARLLYECGQQLKFLLEVCFLNEIGLSATEIESAVNRQRQWKRARWPWP